MGLRHMTPSIATNIVEAKRLSAMPFAESLTMLVYGASGSGKTYFAGTAGTRTLIMNIGSGIATLQAPDFTAKYQANPLIITIPVDHAGSYDVLTDNLDHYLQNRSDEFDTIIIDDASSLHRSALNKAVQINADLQKSQTIHTLNKHGVIVPVVQDYGEEMNVITHFLSTYTEVAKSLNKHLVITAHVKETWKKALKIGDPPTLSRVRPAFTGQTFPDAVPGYFDEVWYFDVIGRGDKKKYRIKTMGDEIIVAKTRHGGIFSELESNLDFQTTVQKIKARKYIYGEGSDLIAVNP